MDHWADSLHQDTMLMRDPQYGWALDFPYSKYCSMNGHGNFLITKNVRLTIDISIYDPSMYTISMCKFKQYRAQSILFVRGGTVDELNTGWITSC